MTVSLESGETIEADLLLVAVGRGPVATGLGYEEAGVAMDRGFVLADERLPHQRRRACSRSATSCPVCSWPTAASRRASSSPRRSPASTRPVIDELGIPRVTYCDPEIASVGLTEAQAREKYGDEIETYEYNLGGNGKSQILQTQGFVKLVREKDGPVVGVHMIGARMGEQVGEAQLIVNWEALPRRRRAADPRAPHPERGARRGPPGPGRQAAARPRLTPTLATRPPDRSHPARRRRPQHMSERVTMPALGESVTEGTVTRWLKSVGDTVEVDEPLLEVSTDKVDTEIPSPVAGTLQEILVGEDDTVPVGADLAVIGDGSGGGSEQPAAEARRRGPQRSSRRRGARCRAARRRGTRCRAARRREPPRQPSAARRPPPARPAAPARAPR